MEIDGECNDDPESKTDESTNPTATDRLFQADGPGAAFPGPIGDELTFVYAGFFEEYVRVGRSERPRDVRAGCRCSMKVPWHATLMLQGVPGGPWQRIQPGNAIGATTRLITEFPTALYSLLRRKRPIF